MIEIISKDLITLHVALSKKGKHPRLIKGIEACMNSAKMKKENLSPRLELTPFALLCDVAIDEGVDVYMQQSVDLLTKALGINTLETVVEVSATIPCIQKLAVSENKHVEMGFLQVMQYFCSPNVVLIMDRTLLEKTLEVCIGRFGKKSALVSNTMSALLKQLSSIICESALADFKKNTDIAEEGAEVISNNTSILNLMIISELYIGILKGQGPSWAPENDSELVNLSLELLIDIIEAVPAIILSEPLIGSLISQELVFIIDRKLRGFADDVDYHFASTVFRAIFVMICNIDRGIGCLLYTFQFFKAKHFTLLSYYSLCLLNMLARKPGYLNKFYSQLQSEKKFFEYANSIQGLADSLVRKIGSFDKFIILPIKLDRVFDPSRKKDLNLEITPKHLFQLLIDYMGVTLDNLYIIATEEGHNFNVLTLFKCDSEDKLPKCLWHFSKVFLPSLLTFSNKIEGDYFLNARNSQLQKMLKLNFYFKNSEMASEIIDAIITECSVKLTSDNLQRVIITSKILVNAAQCLPELQTEDTWKRTLRFMDLFVNNLESYKKGMEKKEELNKDNISSAKASNDAQKSLNNDISITLGTVEGLFSSSSSFSEEQMLNIMSAIISLTEEDIVILIKKKKKGRTVSFENSICQKHLSLFWRANSKRITKLSVCASKLFKIYLEVEDNLVRELGIVQFFRFLKEVLQGSKTEDLECMIEALQSIRSFIQEDSSMNTQQLFMREMIELLDHFGSTAPDRFWLELLDVILCSISGKEVPENVCTKVFKLVQYVKSHHLKHLSVEAMLLFLQLIEAVRKASTIMNEHYSCVELIWEISDYVAKDEEQHKYETVWDSIFRKLHDCCVDSDSQVRSSSLKIYANLISQSGHIFSKEIWLLAFRDLYLTLFDQVIEIFLNFALSKKEQLDFDAPGFVQALQNTFDEETSKREKDAERSVIHRSLSDISKHWLQTITHLIQSFAKITKKFLTCFADSKDDEHALRLTQKIFDSLLFILRIPKKEVLYEGSKAFQAILSAQSPLVYSSLDHIIDIVNQLKYSVLRDPGNEKVADYIKKKVVPEIYSLARIIGNFSGLINIREELPKLAFELVYESTIYSGRFFLPLFKLFLDDAKGIQQMYINLGHSLKRNSDCYAESVSGLFRKLLELDTSNHFNIAFVFKFVQTLPDCLTDIIGSNEAFDKTIVGLTESALKISYQSISKDYYESVKHSKNSSDFAWSKSHRLIDILLSWCTESPIVTPEISNSFLKSYSDWLKDVIKADLSYYNKEEVRAFWISFLEYIEIFQRAIGRASSREEKIPEDSLMHHISVLNEIQSHLTDVSRSAQFGFNKETTDKVAIFAGEMIEVNQRMIASICSDKSKAAEANLKLILKKKRTLEFFIANEHDNSLSSIKKRAMIDDTRAVFRHLKEIRMDVETGRKFIELSAISEALASRFGQKYIHCAPIANELTALIMCDDIIIRTALQDLMREILKS